MPRVDATISSTEYAEYSFVYISYSSVYITMPVIYFYGTRLYEHLSQNEFIF